MVVWKVVSSKVTVVSICCKWAETCKHTNRLRNKPSCLTLNIPKLTDTHKDIKVTIFGFPQMKPTVFKDVTLHVHTIGPWHRWWAAVIRRDSSPRAFETWHNHSGGNGGWHPWGHAASSAWGHTEQLMTLHWWRRASETLGGHCWSTLQQTL